MKYNATLIHNTGGIMHSTNSQAKLTKQGEGGQFYWEGSVCTLTFAKIPGT